MALKFKSCLGTLIRTVVFLSLALWCQPGLTAVDTRLGGANPKSDAGCYEANTIGAMTCYAQGVAVTSGGTTQYAEDAQHTTADSGTLALVVRADAAASLAGTDGDYTGLIVDANGRLHVLDQNSAAILTDTNALVVDAAAIEVDLAALEVLVTGIDSDTNTIQSNSTNALTALQLIDNPVQVLGNDTYLEATDSGFIIGAVRNDTLAALADTDNEIAPLQVNATGALYAVLTANSGVDIGDVDILSIAAGSNVIGQVSIDQTTPGTTNLVQVTDGAGALNVIIDSGTTAVTNAGTFVVQEDGAALTALQLIDNIVVVAGTGTYTEATSSVALIGAVRNDTLATLADTDNEVAPFQVDNEGALYVIAEDTDALITTLDAVLDTISTNITALVLGIIGPANPTDFDSYQQYAINLTTGADQVLVSSAVNKQVWVYGITLTCGDADGQSVSFQDEDNTALSGIVEVSQYGGYSVPPSGNFNMPTFKLGTDKDFEIDITGGDCDGFVTAAVVDVS